MVAPTLPPITLRPADLEDVKQIAQLGSHVFSATYGHSVAPHELQAYLDKSYSTTATTADLSNPAKSMIVATDEENIIVGFALLTRGTSEPCIADVKNKVELQRIYVHPDYHGRGIGKLLMKRVEALAKEEGFRCIWLGVWEENVKAQRVYERSGYKVVGDRDFTVGGVVQTGHIMVKEL